MLRGGLALAIAWGLAAGAHAANDGAEARGQRWYQTLLRKILPEHQEDTGPAAVLGVRTGRWGIFFPKDAPPPPMQGLPGLSPELSAPGYVWNLDTAISRALVANPTLVEAKLMVERQVSLAVEAGARGRPQVAITGGHDWRDPGSLDRGPNPNNQQTALADRSYDIRFEVRQLLFDGGGIAYSVKREKLQTLQTRLALQLAAYRTVALVKQHYDAVLFREATLANAKRREQSLQQVADFTERRWKLGEQTEIDHLRAQTELRLAQADVVKSQRDLQQARIGFARQLYLPVPDASRSISFTLSGELAPTGLTLPRDEAISLAVARRLDLQSAQIQVQLADAVVKAVKSDAFPKIEANVGYGYRSSYYDYRHDLDGWSAGISGRWPIFDGNAVKARTRAYRVEQRVTQVRLEDMELKVRTEVAELYAGLQLARSSLDAQREARELAEKSLAYSKRGYELGQATLEQVLEMEEVLLRSQNAYAEAILTLNATVAQLEYSVGGALPGGRDVGPEVMP